MKMLLWSNLAMSMCIFAFLSKTVQAQDLSSYQWDKRPVLVFTKSASHQEYKQQIQVLNAAQSALAERDVVVLVDAKPETLSDLRMTFMPEDFLFVLIGKDGSVKYRSEEPVSTTKLFEIIDAMPMRQREMQN